MLTFETLIEERFFTVTSDFQTEEYRTQELATASNNWRWIIILQRGHNLSGNPETNIYQLDFINRDNNIRCNEIRVGGWTAILNSVTQGSELRYLQAYFKYASPNGILRFLHLGYPKYLESVLTAIRQLEELAKFNTWSEFDLHKENEQLKLEISLLNKKLTDLEASIKLYDGKEKNEG